MKDILIRNASVVDGTGAAAYEADVRIVGDKIAEVGRLENDNAGQIIDAANHTLAPGSIDMHSHADFSLPVLPTADSLVYQGITTAVIGQCGLSPAPLLEETREEAVAALSGFFGEIARSIPWENWEKSRQALDLIQQARSEGLDVTADLYPYTAGSTSLATLLPQWTHVGGPEKTISHLDDPEARKKMKADMQTGGFARGVEWDKILITSSPVNTVYEGRTIADMAFESDKSGYDWLFDVLLETRLDMGMAVFGMSEDNRRNEMKYPDMMIGTDGLGMATSGPMAKGVPHPRSYGAFPRIIARYVRELNVLTLEETIYRMTGLAAAKLRLGDRGTIKPGNAADLVLFDPQTIVDTATYEKPHQYAEGISHVIVNGQPVIKEAVHTGLRSGRILECS